MTISKDMNLTQAIFQSDSQMVLLEVTAAFGLALNALVTSAQAPVDGFHLHVASFILFGIGAVGMATIRATDHAQSANMFRPASAVYGGIILALVSSTAFGILAAKGMFNNLLAVFILAGFAFFYLFFWWRVRNWRRRDVPLIGN